MVIVKSSPVNRLQLLSKGNLLGCVMPNHWSYAVTRLVASAGSAGGGILALTITMELSGAAETLGWLPWVTWSTLLANYQASLPAGT